MTNDEHSERQEALGPPVQRPVGRPVEQRARTCEQGCNGCDECTDYEDPLGCSRCHGDGMDPWNDYMLPCPECGGRAQ
jgi:DnaJ-class molecular chaperone